MESVPLDKGERLLDKWRRYSKTGMRRNKYRSQMKASWRIQIGPIIIGKQLKKTKEYKSINKYESPGIYFEVSSLGPRE